MFRLNENGVLRRSEYPPSEDYELGVFASRRSVGFRAFSGGRGDG